SASLAVQKERDLLLNRMLAGWRLTTASNGKRVGSATSPLHDTDRSPRCHVLRGLSSCDYSNGRFEGRDSTPEDQDRLAGGRDPKLRTPRNESVRVASGGPAHAGHPRHRCVHRRRSIHLDTLGTLGDRQRGKPLPTRTGAG